MVTHPAATVTAFGVPVRRRRAPRTGEGPQSSPSLCSSAFVLSSELQATMTGSADDRESGRHPARKVGQQRWAQILRGTMRLGEMERLKIALSWRAPRFVSWAYRLQNWAQMPGDLTHPSHPERVCWGCDQYCRADDLACGMDTVRTPHPVELFGDDWNREREPEVDTVADTMRMRVVEELRCVLDPEVGINIVDLGVLYDVGVSGSSVRVLLTLTSPSCPLGEQIQMECTRRVRALRGVTDVQVVLLWDTRWSPERMSPAARAALGSPR